jgi:1-acyl-sn-glycerol-3-phosphate acyltransferase
MSAPAIASVPDPLPGADLRLSPETAWQVAHWTIPRPWKALTRMRVYGADRLPRDSGYVLASNHLAWSDPFVVGMLVAPRVLYYMAKRELWSVPVVGTLIPHTGAFPVDRGQPDRDALRMARSVLDNGQVLGVFVEGTRQKTGEIGNARSGASMLAMGARVPVLPVCVRSGEGFGLPGFPPTSIAVGMPLDLSGLGKGGRAYKAGAERIEVELRRLDDFLRATDRAGRPKRAEPPR